MSSNNNGLPGNQGFPGNPNNMGGFPGGPGGPFGGPNVTHHTDVRITHDDGSWSNAIRSIFIYVTGGYRLYANLARGGTPAQRFFIVGSSYLSDAGTRILKNAINDPNFILNHITSWNVIFNSGSANNTASANVHLDPGTEAAITEAAVNIANRAVAGTGTGTVTPPGFIPGLWSTSGGSNVTTTADLVRLANSRGFGAFNTTGGLPSSVSSNPTGLLPGSGSSTGIEKTGID